MHGTHVLVAGATGAGKGSIIWSTIRGLLPAVRAGLVEIWALDPKLMELSFGRAEIGSMFMAVLIGAIVARDGRSNWYKGVQLITVYVVIALMFYLLPDTAASPQ